MNDQNNTMKTPMPKTLTELCGLDDSALGQYLEHKEKFLKNLDEKTDARIAAALEKNMCWVA